MPPTRSSIKEQVTGEGFFTIESEYLAFHVGELGSKICLFD